MNPKTVAAIACSSVFACACLPGCNFTASWDRAYNLRQWEKTRLAAESAYLDRDYARAEELLRSSVSFARNLGGSDFRLGATLALLGNAVGRQDKLAEARTVYEKALASLNESLSLSPTAFDRRLIEEDIAAVGLSLGDICLKSEDLVSSQRYYELATSLYKQWQGSSASPVVSENFGWTLLGLGVLMMKQGNGAQAAQTFKTALDSAGAAKYSHGLARYLRRLYDDSSKGGTSGASLAAAKAVDRFQEYMFAAKEAAETENFGSAESNYQSAVDLGTEVGVEDAKLSRAYEALAKNQEELKKLSEAEQNYRKALEHQDQVNPSGDEDTDYMLTKLAKMSHSRGDDTSARADLIRQLRLRKTLSGGNSYGVGETMAGLAEVSLALGQTSEACRYAADGWSILKGSTRTRGDVLIALESLSRTLLGLGDIGEAAAANDRMLEIYKEKNLRTWRCLLAEYRRQAINALKGGRINEPAVLSAASIRKPGNRLLLIKQLTADADFLAGHGKLKAGSVLAEGALNLVNSEDSADKKVRAAKIEALTTLATIERQTGNNTRAALLLSEADKLK